MHCCSDPGTFNRAFKNSLNLNRVNTTKPAVGQQSEGGKNIGCVGDKGVQEGSRIHSTHDSAVRAEMPSGMVPLNALLFRSRYLQ